ncbi:PilC/PilY family type IV pilus protein [Acinetobacter radioresistens]|uniref:PilC/PilY family type IV pilus protein n=1 Tax=Acinetobacter radioresistens TaxID=40216 RepID=UPI002005DF2A|nr:PilC/PilY family type IV pilus protein [Acinetobacter radioresistens]MCK4077657.1 pilus assembly protein PilY [Acinetobacter radioresistens]MCK4084293.1 pilus assembly protein PilY [Acinetobacter radioresistens]
MKNIRISTSKNGVEQHKGRCLAVAIITMLSTLLITSSVSQASDLQIYAKPTAGQKTITLMLDTSGSMGHFWQSSGGFSFQDDYGLACGLSYNKTSEATDANGKSESSLDNLKVYYVDSDTTPSYRRRFCKVTGNSITAKVKDTMRGCERITNTNYRCYDRLTRLKDGLFDLLENDTDPNLPSTSIALGNYSADGDGVSGQILKEAKKLGNKGSNERKALKEEIAKLTAYNGTPSAHAYAEAAAYMLGTSTVSSGTYKKEIYKIEVGNKGWGCWNSSYPNLYGNRCYDSKYYYSTPQTYSYDQVTTYYKCTSWNSINYDSGKQTCSSYSWNSLGQKPNDLENYEPSGTNPIIYTGNEVWTGTNADSGFKKSVDSAKIEDKTKYSSPLPAADKRASCDGNGIYFLSDGAANSSSAVQAQTLMRAALDNNNFTCPTSGGLRNLDESNKSKVSAWNCMGELAKYLFSGNNPQSAQIRTAFVGFGTAFAGLDKDYVQEACKLASRTQPDRKGDDACSPNQNTIHKVQYPGYGNGLYYEASSADEVTNSVLEFIRTFDNTLEPVPTGAISIPVDALNPNGFQSYGYLRMFAPTPGSNNLVWSGNLKKYQIVLTGVNAGALGDKTEKIIFDKKGEFSTSTHDLWNNTGVADGKLIDQGGVYWNLPMPTQAVAAIPAVDKKRAVPAIVAAPNDLRRLFTDVSSVIDGVLQTPSNGSSLLMIPDREANKITNSAYILDRFTKQDILKSFPDNLKVKLLNYLGYDLPLSTTTTLPATLTTPPRPFITLGGSIHSYPVQLTYSGELNTAGDLTDIRSQSVLFGSMEGAIHIVDSKTGVEQMAFVPATILNDPEASKALRGVDQAGKLSHGMDGNWVADPAYTFSKGTGENASKVEARQMNVYGGMRMGGKSYFGLDVLNPSSPKLLFSIQGGVGNFARMGQTWSKPVIANIRYNGKITRVMIVGGGYDMCYENPRFKLSESKNSNADYPDTSCNNKAQADGNAVYIIDANTGTRLWWASNTGANTDSTDMKHSIVSRISTLDRDGDGLVDHLYFGDLGGQVFRVDLDNLSNTGASSLAKRVVRLANLATDTSGVNITNGDQPRFYQPPTLTIHDVGANTFILVGIASGDRSTPLDVVPTVGRDGMLPTNALTNRPDNHVYGIIDRDFIKRNLITGSPLLISKDIKLNDLQKNPQLQSGDITKLFFPNTGKAGWYRSLRSDTTGVDNVNRVSGGIKAFEEEPIALKDNLFIPVYDPQGTGVEAPDSCSTRIVGESDFQQYCLPFGACLTSSGTKDTAAEAKTGFLLDEDKKNKNVIGSGIRGITLGPRNLSGNGGGGTNSCGSLTLIGNEKGSGEWSCTRVLNPLRWYEKYVKAGN